MPIQIKHLPVINFQPISIKIEGHVTAHSGNRRSPWNEPEAKLNEFNLRYPFWVSKYFKPQATGDILLLAGVSAFRGLAEASALGTACLLVKPSSQAV